MNRIPTISDVLMRQQESEDIYIGDTSEQLGCITAADTIMIDGKIVTREDVRRLQSEIEAFKSLYSAAKGSADKLNEMLRGAKEDRDALAATVSEFLAKVAKVCSYLNDSGLKTNGLAADVRDLRDLLSVDPQQHLRDVRSCAISEYIKAFNVELDIKGFVSAPAFAEKFIKRIQDGEV